MPLQALRTGLSYTTTDIYPKNGDSGHSFLTDKVCHAGSDYPTVPLKPEVHINIGGPLDGPVLQADDIIAAVADVAPCAHYLTAICTAVTAVIMARDCVPQEAGVAALAGESSAWLLN